MAEIIPECCHVPGFRSEKWIKLADKVYKSSNFNRGIDGVM